MSVPIQTVYANILPFAFKNDNYYLANAAKPFTNRFFDSVISPVIASSSTGSMWRTPAQISNMALMQNAATVPEYEDYAPNVTFYHTQYSDLEGPGSYVVVNDMPKDFADDSARQRSSGFVFVPPTTTNYQVDALLLPYPNANSFSGYGNTLRVGNTPGDTPNSSLDCLDGVYMDNLRCVR